MKGNSYSSPLEREHHVGVVQRCNSLSQTDIDLWNKTNLITEHPIGFPSTSSYSLNITKKPSIFLWGKGSLANKSTETLRECKTEILFFFFSTNKRSFSILLKKKEVLRKKKFCTIIYFEVWKYNAFNHSKLYRDPESVFVDLVVLSSATYLAEHAGQPHALRCVSLSCPPFRKLCQHFNFKNGLFMVAWSLPSLVPSYLGAIWGHGSSAVMHSSCIFLVKLL